MRPLPLLALIAALALPATAVAHSSHHAKPNAAHAKKKPPKKKPKPPKKPQTITIKNGGAFPAPNPVATLTTPCAGADLIPSAANLGAINAAILCLVNQERAKQNIGALNDNSVLDGVAQAYSTVVVGQDNWSHTGPDGSTPETRILAAKYVNPKGNYQLGENLGEAESELATPAALVADWMNSPEHRANILNAQFRDSGTGITLGVPSSLSTGAPTGATFVQDFGVRGKDIKKKKPSGGGSPITFG